ncbi:MAG: hypothetical protein HGB18_00345 [Candidatus Moranbacteria bacterium]|nr:hypothetical protein [Candidatus Moranbacteria bacterium]
MLIATPVTIGVTANASAQVVQTYQAPASASLTVTKQGGNAIVTWKGLDADVAFVEHYIGNGKKGGFIKPIKVPAGASSVVLADIAKNGGRFNLKMADGTFLHLECGGNPETTMPKFVGCHVDCSWVDTRTGQPAGALEVD